MHDQKGIAVDVRFAAGRAAIHTMDMHGPFDKLGVFVAGGPAAGINGVIKGLVQEADNAGLKVFGFVDGAQGLVEGRFVHLTRQMVEDIPILGGSCIGTSRFKVEPARGDVERIYANLRKEGIDALISIGGEGTLMLADQLRRLGLRIVHVPKTIDNDIWGVAKTFGFDTAVNEAVRALTAVKLDAQASDMWFVVEIMGRFAGHLALDAGLAAACTRVLIPEEGIIQVDELASLVESRIHCGHNWGVILVAESAHFGEGHITHGGRLGGVADVLAERLEAACAARKLPAKIRTSNLGYFLRCALPTGFDRSYAGQLGFGAGQMIQSPRCSGHMVTIVNDQLVPVPMEECAGKVKLVDLEGARFQALRSLATYESARADLLEMERCRASAGQTLRWLDTHATMDTVKQIAMRLGIPAETLLDVLEDVAEVETAQPGSEVVLTAGVVPPS